MFIEDVYNIISAILLYNSARKTKELSAKGQMSFLAFMSMRCH